MVQGVYGVRQTVLPPKQAPTLLGMTATVPPSLMHNPGHKKKDTSTHIGVGTLALSPG